MYLVLMNIKKHYAPVRNLAKRTDLKFVDFVGSTPTGGTKWKVILPGT